MRQIKYSEVAPVYEPTKGDVIKLAVADRERMEQDTKAGSTRNGITILTTSDLTKLGGDWKALSRLLFVKRISWAYEKEVRLLVELEQARDTGKTDSNGWPIKVIDIPSEAIKEIYSGVRTSDADLARAVEIARSENKRGLFEGHVSSHAFRIQKTGELQH